MPVIKKRHATPFAALLPWLLPLLLSCGCRDDGGALRFDDLTPAEQRYVTRFVTLERARAVALVDRETGVALLDSLAAAWGDSALAEALAAQSPDTRRQGQLNTLIADLLDAEADSLLNAPDARRLTDPLPDPPTARDEQSPPGES